MGYYIETPSGRDKAGQLRRLAGAVDVDPDKVAWPPPEGKALVCVVDNGWMEAAAVAYDEAEYNVFNAPDDTRPRTWLYMDADSAANLSGAPVA